jgi:hypothetical protein
MPGGDEIPLLVVALIPLLHADDTRSHDSYPS